MNWREAAGSLSFYAMNVSVEQAEREAVQDEGRGSPRSPMCPICGQTDRSRGSAAGCRVCREFLDAHDGRERGWI